MTLKKLAESILTLLENDPEGKLLDLPVFASHSASGASYSVSYVFFTTKTPTDETGPLRDLADGAKYICIDVD